MYSERLHNLRVGHDIPACYTVKVADKMTTLPDDVAEDKLRKFCMAGDLVGVNPTVACNLFNEYLAHYAGGKTITLQGFGRLVRRCFPSIKVKKKRFCGDFTHIYYMDEIRI